MDLSAAAIEPSINCTWSHCGGLEIGRARVVLNRGWIQNGSVI